MILVSVCILALLVGTSQGIVGGRLTYINYNSQCGVWNDPTTRSGAVLEECCPVDMSYPGTPWQQLSLSYTCSKGTSHFSGNTGGGSCPSYTVLSERVLDDGTGLVGIEHVYRMGLLTVTKTETWDFHGKTISIRFKVKYTKESYLTKCEPLHRLSVMHAVDPDQDWEPFGRFDTFNDVVYNGPSGLFAESTGPLSCKSFGYGICANRYEDWSQDSVGFSRWFPTTPATLRDPDGELRDDTMHYQHTEERPLYCGDEREFGFFAVWGRCYDEGRKNFIAAHKKFCEKCHKLEIAKDPPKPRCKGHCPCVKADCDCNYKCPTDSVWTPVDIARDMHSLEKVVAKCDGRKRKKRQDEIDPDMANIDGLAVDEAMCSVVKSELKSAKRRR